MDSWDLLKDFYRKELGIDPKVIDYIATFQILKLAVEGKSISNIALSQNVDEIYVQQTLLELLEFSGLEQDTGFNARSIYKRYPYNWYAFDSTAKSLQPGFSDSMSLQMFKVNKVFDEIERKVAEYDASA
jgi:hypothetical protein